ncbi:protocadherin-15-like isoform X1 [Dinothrombium tinctorium]|uniref:Protocadherin-15-like isoform X1 n=1 Tax=Dinothrombium tinctorium TaxID=1965070 RepID=A0A3S3Q955_9ACAR|nr:protocadherin-15-like isoform X1 [Dinothrombium tinctorium]RWS15849.1 protocadherin-15-like isoform X1 [Dinothrombium tinctorium]RWS16124.1 protocadherin-15-like isoform X1 [Dinothrombium tinctorium]
MPSELPIKGDETQISLVIQSETQKYFDLHGKRLVLNRPIDRDGEELSSIYIQISCIELHTGVKKNIPVLVKVVDVNDNWPQFTSNFYNTSISELVPVGTTVFRNLLALDRDSGPNGLVEYYTAALDGTASDGYNYFEIKMPHQGLVTVKKQLDYEKTNVYYLKVVATDKASNISKRLSSTATLTINVEDGDDLSPVFVYDNCLKNDGFCINPEYKASVASGSEGGTVKILPDRIKAEDRDSLNATIRYSFADGIPPFYKDFFAIDPLDGNVRHVRPVDRSQAKSFVLKVKAEQEDNKKQFAIAKLTINIFPVDKNPPIITPSSFDGYVYENAPIGSTVFGEINLINPLKLTVTDKDITNDDAPAVYAFEITSNSFRVNGDGHLIVNESNLDRDPPNPQTYKFQVIARQIGSPAGKGASAPITLNVHLIDINDNSPKLIPQPPVYIQAGDGARVVTKISAKDVDEVDKGRISYSIYHVSNNGKEKFRIDSKTGEISAIGKLIAGQQYSVTVQASDSANKVAQNIVEVIVVPGPNRGGPIFNSERYEAEVSEGISLFSTVISVNAVDPEGDFVSYSIIEGNFNEDFAIGFDSGIISVAKHLNREEVAAYLLIVKAEDKGGLYSTASVAITVTDINDENPQFMQSSYTFKVDEEVSNAFIGKVTARDADIGENGEVFYKLSDDLNFQINSNTGEIYTRRALDYEKQSKHQFVVTACDKSPNSRLATASVVVEVLDVQDEVPYFEKASYTALAAENSANVQLIQVRAIDLDSIQSITYVIREGDTSLFAIDPLSGVLRTLQGLDFEKKSQHIVIVGTLENNSNDEKATCVVQINVQDQNDNFPVFTSSSAPVRLQDSVPLGTVVTTLSATDSDGTSPGNQIRYELIGRDKATFYFMIDANSGVVSVKDDLRKEPESEYKLVVRAKDLGIPSLSTTTTVTVFVEHVTTAAPHSGLGFAESKYTVEVEENTLPEVIIKTISIINKPRGNFPMSCEIISGNEGKRFYITVSDQKDCELRVRDQQLDYEKQSKYFLTIHLNAVGGLTGISRLITQVTINVIDVNDNRPEFIIPKRYAHMTGSRYVSAIAIDAPADSQVVQVKAKDLDSQSNGAIVYELMPHSDPEGVFKIDYSTGILRTSRPTEDIPDSELPLKVKVIARDSPQLQSASLSQSAEVVVNLIEDKHRIILVIEDTSPGRVQDVKEEVLNILQERTGMIAGWEKAESMKIQRNHTIESDVTGTDAWLYLIEPHTLKILHSNDSRIKSTVFDIKSQNSLMIITRQKLGFNAIKVRRPYTAPKLPTSVIISSPVTTDIYDFGAVLIVLGAIIAIFGILGITYQCCMSPRKINQSKEPIKKIYVSSSSRIYDPIYVEPNMKEYETQVLQMSVPIDDEASIEDLINSKSTLKGLMSVRGVMSDVSFVPRSRSYINQSPESRATLTTGDKGSSASSSNSCSTNSNIKSKQKLISHRSNNCTSNRQTSSSSTINSNDRSPLNPKTTEL